MGGGRGALLGAGAPWWQAVRWDRMQEQKCQENANVEGEGMQMQAPRLQRAQKASKPAHARLSLCRLHPRQGLAPRQGLHCRPEVTSLAF